MTQDMNVLSEANTNAAIRLRVENFDLMMRAIGKDTDGAIGALIGVHPKTVSRARNGIIGEEFIAKTLAALRRHERLLTMCGLAPTFDNLFEIVEPEAALR